jgi:2-phosphosulfolactate phosphatase
MATTLEVLFSPAEFSALAQRDLTQTVCVVFDVLRATTTMLTALANGAQAIIPVSEVSEALDIKGRRPEVRLAGERDGVRIRAAQTGSIDFDLGNSPREFTPDKVKGQTIVTTTTNGTRALRACSAAKAVLIGSFLNLRATADWLRQETPPRLLIVCAGTMDQAAYEDTLAGGALCDRLWPAYTTGQIADSALMARRLYQETHDNLLDAFRQSRNGQRLLAEPELADDLAACAQRDVLTIVAAFWMDGTVRTLNTTDGRPQPAVKR